jgi:hypothetical protein
MKPAVRFIGIVVLFLGSLYANAQTEPIGGWFSNNGVDRGRYECRGSSWYPCEMMAQDLTPGGNDQGFISSITNNSLNACCHIWRKGDTVTLCNGSAPGDDTPGQCVTFTYNGIGNWFSGGPFTDDGTRYGDKATVKHIFSDEQYSPQCSISGSISGHYEWNDYYSDGNYIGSGDLQYVVDGVSLNRNCV